MQHFHGEHITVTLRDNGTYGLNFRDVHIEEPGFSVAQFATAVANELMWALDGLIEEELFQQAEAFQRFSRFT
ncbi:MAG: hypothetical protein IJS48_01545 [Prevotella sp.]|nr:hypothetical protein [Prevotella sp.]